MTRDTGQRDRSASSGSTAAAGRRAVGVALGKPLAVLVLLGVIGACTPVGEDAIDGAAGEPATTTPTPLADPTGASRTPTPTPAPTSPSPPPTAAPTGDDTAGDDSPSWVQRAAAPWRPEAEEVLVEAKRLAAATVVTLTTYDPDDDQADRLAALGAGDGPDGGVEGLADASATVGRPGVWSRGRIVYPQLGGFTEDPDVGRASCSVMVVVEQTWGTDDDPTIEQRTVDVRLARDDRDAPWRVTRIASASGEPLPTDPTAHPVLTDPRVALPDAARWDIASGDIDPALLDLLHNVGELHPIEVTVLERGHPINVFATDRLSAHTLGRAADIHTVDGASVVSSHDLDSATRALAEWLYDDPRVSNIGSPWALDGFGGRSFTDLVHADHIHVAVSPSTTG